MPARRRPSISAPASSLTDHGIAVEGAVADDAAGAPVEVEHRREGQIDAAGAQLGGQHVTDAPRAGRAAGIACPTARRGGASAAGG
jgi:hypothetical protein